MTKPQLKRWRPDSMKKLLRGRILSFHREPESITDTAAYLYIEDGAILIEDGLITDMGDYRTVTEKVDASCKVIDHSPCLLMPGFIDAHIHFPQVRVIASWGLQLMDWLNQYTFPEEGKFADPDYARQMTARFFAETLAQGTTTVAAFSSVHHEATHIFFEEAAKRNLRVIAGKVMMDRHAPDYLCDTPQSSYDDSKALINKWHGNKRLSYAISPRFAITSTPAQLELAGTLAREHPGCYIQTHLCENPDEIALTATLYPNIADYFAIYEHYHLAGPKSLFGHCIHLKEREMSALADTGSVAVFCPTSNLFLGSGLYNEATLKTRNIRTAIATDVGGGSSYSMLRTLDEGYKILQLQSQKLNPLKAFYWITLGNSRALGLEDKIGTLNIGTEADIVVLDSQATSAMKLRFQTIETLAEELFILQTLGDDRSIVHTYAAGQSCK